MDLELNFAAPSTSAVKARPRPASGGHGGGVHWKQRMLESQSARRQEKKASKQQQQQQAKPSIATTSSKSIAASSSLVKSSSANVKERASSGKSDKQREAAILRQQDTEPTSEPTSDKAAPPAKRQVISSLFSRAPREVVATEEDYAAAEQLPAVLDPSNAPSLSANFTDMPIRKELVSHLTGKMGLQRPTTVQKLAVPFLCNPSSSKKDALLQAQTGSGKTLSYLLPIVQDLVALSETMKGKGKSLERSVGTLAIVLVPTRELANQIFEVANKLLGFAAGSDQASHRWITPGLLTGGAHRQHEKARLRKGIPLLIATPGRLLDHLEATKAFRIAGETIRIPSDPSRQRKGVKKPVDSDDEFAVEDQAYTAPADEDENAISSDEDFENMAKSRSHRLVGQESSRTPRVPPEDPLLALRWLVLDEADRLMDMGFVPQISSIVKLLEERLEKRKAALVRAGNRGAVSNRLAGKVALHQQVASRRTVLCSATVEERVQELAGIALKDPLLIKGDDSGANEPELVNGSTTAPEGATTKYAPPTQLSQYYAVVPAKLRFVGLVALLRQTLLAKAAKNKRQKILVFMSCTDAVDFHWQTLSGMHMGKAEESAKEQTQDKLVSKSALIPGVPVYRLHGSLDLQTRLASLKAFSKESDEPAVLFCTSVAARGLDVQDVTCVIQYDLPTEGGVNEYIHRVGRTARAGAAGQAWAFLLPSETGWVAWADEGMQQSSEQSAKNVRLVERKVDGLLKAGFGGNDAREWETRATDVQMAFERWVAEDEANARLAKKAFSSHVRAYATHPSSEKQFFHVKNLHLGHLAKAFGLREAPAGIGGGAGKAKAAGKASPEKSTVGRKRKKDQIRTAAEPSSDEDEEKLNRRPKIQRSGRAIDGKGLHGPKAVTGSDFNLASTSALEAMLKRK